MIGRYKAFSAALASLALTGCLSIYQMPAGSPSATFSLEVYSDATGTTLRTAYARALRDTDCAHSAHGYRLGDMANSNSNPLRTTPVSIGAQGPFAFTANYTDARFAQNRSCRVTATFVPRPGARYKAVLNVQDNVQKCELGVYDATSGSLKQVEFSMPPHSCGDQGEKVRGNGQPLWTDWHITVQRIWTK